VWMVGVTSPYRSSSDQFQTPRMWSESKEVEIWVLSPDFVNNQLQSLLYRGVGICHEEKCLESSAVDDIP
jgi:hypothetical protein